MSRYFTRPENAISKAEEFMKVGKSSFIVNKDQSVICISKVFSMDADAGMKFKDPQGPRESAGIFFFF